MKNSREIITTLLITVGIMAMAYAFTNSINNDIKPIHSNYVITKTWKLPSALNEVSGISWIATNTIACIQDEEGVIYIYDLDKHSIIKEIPFAGSGDYEGIAVADTNAYVMRSDGLVYVISDYNTASKSTTSFQTGFNANNNMESLYFNPKSNMLITAPKDRDSNSDTYKGIYQISSDDMESSKPPLFKINMNDQALKNFKGKKEYKTFNPSDIAINPITNEMYVLEGKNPKLLVLDADGNFKALHHLNPSEFPQPEGITFSPEGTLYISSEAKNGSATIQLVEFK